MLGMKTPERSKPRRDGSVVWKLRFRYGGRETSRTFETAKDARDFARWIDRFGVKEALALLDQTQQSDPSDHYTVASWATEHVASLTGVTKGTVARYEAYIKNDLGRLGELPLTAVTPTAISKWVRSMEDSGSSGKTIKNKHGFVSSVFAGAIERELIGANPCRRTRLPETTKTTETFLTHDEYTRFLGCFVPYWLPLVETLFGTGMRWGEITALAVGDVDLDAATVRVRRAWKSAPGGAVIGTPKSKKSRRWIPIAPATVTVLRPLCDGRAGDALVFVNQRGDPVRGQTFHDNVWQPAVRLANGEDAQRDGRKRVSRRHDAAGNALAPLDPPLGKRPRIHDARHTYASWLVNAGTPLNVVQTYLGHESIKTTVDRYSHLLPSAQGYVRDALTVALSASRPELTA